MKTAVLIVVVALLSACSTTPVNTRTASAVPAERIYEPSYIGAALTPDNATILFSRDEGFFGSGCSHDMFVDNIKVFSIRHGEQITIHVTPGQHFFRLETGGGLCPNISASQETAIAAGQREVFRILLPSDGSLRLTRMG